MSKRSHNKARKVSPAWFQQRGIEPHFLVHLTPFFEKELLSPTGLVKFGHWASVSHCSGYSDHTIIWMFADKRDAMSFKLAGSEKLRNWAGIHLDSAFWAQAYPFFMYRVTISRQNPDWLIKFINQMPKQGAYGFFLSVSMMDRTNHSCTLIFSDKQDAEMFLQTSELEANIEIK